MCLTNLIIETEETYVGHLFTDSKMTCCHYEALHSITIAVVITAL